VLGVVPGEHVASPVEHDRDRNLLLEGRHLREHCSPRDLLGYAIKPDSRSSRRVNNHGARTGMRLAPIDYGRVGWRLPWRCRLPRSALWTGEAQEPGIGREGSGPGTAGYLPSACERMLAALPNGRQQLACRAELLPAPRARQVAARNWPRKRRLDWPSLPGHSAPSMAGIR
jgi:hypothetical protein